MGITILFTDHFSQLVWRGSKELGIGTAQSKSGNFFLVARYSPPGNIDGLFQDNVPDAKETTSDELQQDNKENNNNLDNRPPGIATRVFITTVIYKQIANKYEMLNKIFEIRLSRSRATKIHESGTHSGFISLIQMRIFPVPSGRDSSHMATPHLPINISPVLSETPGWGETTGSFLPNGTTRGYGQISRPRLHLQGLLTSR